MFRCVGLGHEERVEGGGMDAITSREWSFLCVQSECQGGTIPLKDLSTLNSVYTMGMG